MLSKTGCDGLMIGRGSIINPFIFHQIKAHFSGIPYQPKWEDLVRYFDVYLVAFPPDTEIKTAVNKLKQLLGFIFKGNARLLEKRQSILTSSFPDPHSFLAFAKSLLEQEWSGQN